jgi:hypothetical protein
VIDRGIDNSQRRQRAGGCDTEQEEWAMHEP